jgi:hypothetical protein
LKTGGPSFEYVNGGGGGGGVVAVIVERVVLGRAIKPKFEFGGQNKKIEVWRRNG